MDLTEEQILTVAPDESTQKGGIALANPSKWLGLFENEPAIWAESKNLTGKPFQTQIDLSNTTFKCTCPARKFPCKHGIGLALTFLRHKEGFTAAEMPTWVADWMAKQEKKPKKEIKQEIEESGSKQKTTAARQSKVEDGVAELTIWIKDLVRNGMISMPEKDKSYFENMSKRMIDAQAPGLAGMIRYLGNTNFYQEGWQSGFLDQLLRLYMVAGSWRNIDQLDPLLQSDVRNWIGFTYSQEELKKEKGILDTWMVLSRTTTADENITTERTWLYGTDTDSFAQILQFSVRGQGEMIDLNPGSYLKAELVFYPSVTPSRAIIKRRINAEAVNKIATLPHWKKVLETETEYNSLLPFRSERLYIVSQLTPVFFNGKWWLQDREQKHMQVRNEQRIWNLLAISGGAASDMVLIGHEDSYEPLGIWYQQQYFLL